MNIVALIVGAIGLWGCYASRGMRDARCDDSHPGATEPHIPEENERERFEEFEPLERW